MIGTLVNVGTIIAGSLVGGLFKRVMSQRVNDALFIAMGMAAFGLGINSVVQNMPDTKYPVLFIVSLALGGALGTVLRLQERVDRITSRKGDGKLGQGIVTGCLIFCIGTLSILGPVQSALYQDHTFLFTNATLDLVSSIVFASTYGIGMLLAAPALFLWQGMFYLVAHVSSQAISDALMAELLIVGGLLITGSGLALLNLKDCKTLNFLPALAIPIVWFVVKGLVWP